MGLEQVRVLCQAVLEACDLLLPSGAEASMLTGDRDEETACRALVARGIPIAALKRGEQGSPIFTAEQALEVPSLPVAEVGPTGAGDCCGGAFVVGLLEGWDLEWVARFANVAGALSVTRQGPTEPPAPGSAGAEVKRSNGKP